MKRVLVAMSGGVDSSAAAALLKEQGYFVAGGFMKNFSAESWEGIVSPDCPWEQDFADVQAVCNKLGIECRSFNFEKEYQNRVIEYFFSEYATGRTPNPDVMCNKEIKFGLFLEKALELGFDYIATGHYARIRQIPMTKSQFPNKSQTQSYQLYKGEDPKKDQSYFLYTLTQNQLAHTLFPVGEYTKAEIRQLARKFGLPNAEKKDSQGICFVGHVNLREFLKRRIPEKVGQVVNANGEVIGRHRGAWYYTIGQRHGLGIGGGMPYYIAQKDILSNTITVVNSARKPPLKLRGGEGELYSSSALLRDVNWITQPPQFPLSCQAKIRYQQPDQACTVFSPPARGGDEEGVGEAAVKFKSPQFAIAPGQSVVFYDHDTVLGGGIVV